MGTLLPRACLRRLVASNELTVGAMSGAWTRLLVAAALTCTCQALVIEPRQSVVPRTAYDGTVSDASGDACLSLSAEDCSLSSLLSLRGGSLSTWWYKTLAKLGIFLKKGRLLVLGLDNAGKSTLLTVLLRNEVVPTAPTHQPVTDEVCVFVCCVAPNEPQLAALRPPCPSTLPIADRFFHACTTTPNSEHVFARRSRSAT